MKKRFLLLICLPVFLFGTAFYLQNDPWVVPDKYKTMKNPTSASDSECIAVGKSLYEKHCRSCHGAAGLGDGKKASEIDTPMPDLTSSDYKKQAAGVKYYQSFVGRKDMPNFEKKILSEDERWCVINYMEKF